MKNRNILIISPSRIISGGLERLFSEHGEFKVVDTFTELPQDLSYLRALSVSLVILDPSVPGCSSRSNIRTLLNSSLDAPLIAVRTNLFDDDFYSQFDSVINLYDSPTVIVGRCRKALDLELDSSRGEGGELTAREKDILVSVAKGKLNKEIADEYNLSVYTVMTHRKNITRKTGIKSVAGLTVYAMLNGLIDPSSPE